MAKKEKLEYPFNLLGEVRRPVYPNPINYPNTIDTDIEVAINMLEPEQVAVIHMRFRDEMTYKAIADIIGSGTEHVRTVLNKATRRLAHPAISRYYIKGVKGVVDKLEADIKELKDTVDSKDGEIESLNLEIEGMREEIQELQLQVNESTY